MSCSPSIVQAGGLSIDKNGRTGFQYTDEQQARIDQIHQDMKSRMDAVVKDEKLTAEQRDAMLAGYRRMGRSQVFRVLTTQQQKEVLKRIRDGLFLSLVRNSP